MKSKTAPSKLAWFPRAAQLLDCHYFDANDVVIHYNIIDYMHLDVKGHRQLADALIPLIKELTL